VPRRIGPYDILHLVNLVTLDDQWRSSKQAPPMQTNIRLRYYASDRIDGVYLASPDVNYGRTSSLPFTTGQDPRGAYVEFIVPQLAFWDMIYVRRHV
jgi:dextranase